MTAGIAAVNLAGPKARDILSKITSVDLSPVSFPYMACREGTVAGRSVHLAAGGICRGNRLGDLRFPAEYGGYGGCPAEAGKELLISSHSV